MAGPGFFISLHTHHVHVNLSLHFYLLRSLFSEMPGEIGELLGDSSVPRGDKVNLTRLTVLTHLAFTLINLTQAITCTLNVA